jgi:hypothetical protein
MTFVRVTPVDRILGWVLALWALLNALRRR